MKTTLATATAIAVVVLACGRLATVPAPSSTQNCFCFNPAGACDSLCSTLPINVNIKVTTGYFSHLAPDDQVPFDVFSWQTFAALNWPSDTSGNPLPGPITANATAPRVWEYYTDPAQLFSSNTTAPLLLRMESAKSRGQKFLYMDAKMPNAFDPLNEFLESDGFPLIDRNLNFVLYEIRVNPDEATFIQSNHLNTKQGIYNYYQKEKSFSFPASKLPNTAGAMEIKAAWRLLDSLKGDQPSRFYTRRATVFIPGENTVSGNPLVIENALVGLVGMHVIRQIAQPDGTLQSQRLIWSSFEHVDNSPPVNSNGGMTTWSFFNNDCTDCPINIAPQLLPGDNKQYKWDTVAPYAARYAYNGHFGSQVKQLLPSAFACTDSLNQKWQAKLQGSVWANYRLVGTQWFVSGEQGAVNTPVILANTAIESYMQGTSSCISCHQQFAKVIVNGDTIATDFSFLFGAAQ